MSHRIACLIAVAVVFLLPQIGSGQMIHSSTGAQTFGDSFYEHFGINWSIQGDNFFANFGGPPLLPAFGNPDPNSGLNTGVAFRRGDLRGTLGLTMSQGSQRSISSTTPSLTTMNGAAGMIGAQTIRPFVTGISPVIAGNSYGSPVTDNASSQMVRSHLQAQSDYLQSRKLANLNRKQQRAVTALNRAKEAEESGDLKTARANYRQALLADQGPLRREILIRMARHGWR